EEVDIELGDVLDMPRLLDVIKRHRVTHIVHAAGFVGAVSAANPALSVQVNVMGMVNVLEAARAFDVPPVVYTPATGAYARVAGLTGPGQRSAGKAAGASTRPPGGGGGGAAFIPGQMWGWAWWGGARPPPVGRASPPCTERGGGPARWWKPPPMGCRSASRTA